jgi:hypothetical protein
MTLTSVISATMLELVFGDSRGQTGRAARQRVPTKQPSQSPCNPGLRDACKRRYLPVPAERAVVVHNLVRLHCRVFFLSLKPSHYTRMATERPADAAVL